MIYYFLLLRNILSTKKGDTALSILVEQNLIDSAGELLGEIR